MNFCGECGDRLHSPNGTANIPRVCLKCGWEWWNPPVPVVLVMVKDNMNNIVYTRNKNFPEGMWGLVSGFVEQGETFEKAAIREVLEETGLTVRVKRYIGSFVGSSGFKPENVYISYLCEPLEGELKAGDDAEEVHLGPIDLTRFIPNSVAYKTVLEAERLTVCIQKNSRLY